MIYRRSLSMQLLTEQKYSSHLSLCTSRKHTPCSVTEGQGVTSEVQDLTFDPFYCCSNIEMKEAERFTVRKILRENALSPGFNPSGKEYLSFFPI